MSPTSLEYPVPPANFPFLTAFDLGNVVVEPAVLLRLCRRLKLQRLSLFQVTVWFRALRDVGKEARQATTDFYRDLGAALTDRIQWATIRFPEIGIDRSGSLSVYGTTFQTPDAFPYSAANVFFPDGRTTNFVAWTAHIATRVVVAKRVGRIFDVPLPLDATVGGIPDSDDDGDSDYDVGPKAEDDVEPDLDDEVDSDTESSIDDAADDG